MTAPSNDDAEKVYRYLTEFICTKNYPPTISQIEAAVGINWRRVEPALRVLHQAGKDSFSSD